MIVKSEFIISETCKYFECTPEEIFIKSRKTEVRIKRYIIQYLHSKYTKLSLEKIGELSIDYGRNEPHTHASVLNAIKRVLEFINPDPRIGNDDIKLHLSKIEPRLFILREKKIGKKDSDELKIINMSLTHSLINLRRENNLLRSNKAPVKIYSKLDLEVLDFLNNMEYQDKKDALHILEIKKKVRENMTHKKLRNQLN